jgi:hypothetical protein
MARNRKLELNNVGSGRWETADGRFGILQRLMPINPMEVTSDFKINKEYSIHSFEDYKGPRSFIELAPEIGRVSVYREVFPWLGAYTGEGSFVLGHPELMEPKPMGRSKQVEEILNFLDDVLVENNHE